MRPSGRSGNSRKTNIERGSAIQTEPHKHGRGAVAPTPTQEPREPGRLPTIFLRAHNGASRRGSEECAKARVGAVGGRERQRARRAPPGASESPRGAAIRASEAASGGTSERPPRQGAFFRPAPPARGARHGRDRAPRARARTEGEHASNERSEERANDAEPAGRRGGRRASNEAVRRGAGGPAGLKVTKKERGFSPDRSPLRPIGSSGCEIAALFSRALLPRSFKRIVRPQA